MEKKKIYIAGKINGLTDYKKIFAKAQKELESRGFIVMNPAVLGEGFPYEAYMPICLQMLEACDYMYMLRNWEDSKGAKVELDYGRLKEKTIIYQSQEDNDIIDNDGDIERNTNHDNDVIDNQYVHVWDGDIQSLIRFFDNNKNIRKEDPPYRIEDRMADDGSWHTTLLINDSYGSFDPVKIGYMICRVPWHPAVYIHGEIFVK